jgi:hypothetical protein
LGAAASQGLVAALGGIDRGIEKLAMDSDSAQSLLLDEMAQRLLNFSVQDIGKFMGVVAIGGLLHEGLHGCEQSAVAGKPDGGVRPQSLIIKASDLGQGVEAPTMGIAGEVIKLLQFAEHRQIGVAAERAFQLR